MISTTGEGYDLYSHGIIACYTVGHVIKTYIYVWYIYVLFYDQRIIRIPNITECILITENYCKSPNPNCEGSIVCFHNFKLNVLQI